MPKKYRMVISRLTIDKLGVKLYDKVSAVIAELISNSYDADAKLVTISAPMNQFLATKAGGVLKDKGFEVTIIDDGIGMLPNELQDYFLVVGSERRKDKDRGAKSKIFKREVTGRKGVGKLAPFGICTVMEVISSGGERVTETAKDGTSIEGYRTSHIILDYDDINQPTDAEYFPKIGKYDQTLRSSQGTTITLRQFNRRKVPSLETLEKQISQRFGMISPTWKIVVRDNTKLTSDPTFERIVGQFDVPTMPKTKINFTGPEITKLGGKKSDYKVIGPDGNDDPSLSCGFEYEGQFYPVRGWVAYSKVPYKDELMAGIRIYCNGKIAAQTAVFGRPAGFTGEHTVRSYLVGELHADWLDESEDLIQTDRRDILWSDEVAQEFQAWGQKIVAHVGRISRDPMRAKRHERFMEAGDLKKRVNETFPGPRQERIRDQAMEIGKVLGRSLSDGDLEDPEVVESFVDLTLMLAPHVTLDEMLRAAGNDEKSPIASVTAILRTARIAELSSFGRVAEDRIKVIERLRGLIKKEPDEVELQNLIAQAPWLINPQWAPITANQGFTSLQAAFRRFYKQKTKKPLNIGTFQETGKRPDFVLSNQDGALQIIEIKKPKHKIRNDEMGRIDKYVELFDAFLNDKANADFLEMFSGFKVTLVADGEALSGTSKRAFSALISNGIMTHITWDVFLLRTEKMHRDFLKHADKLRKIDYTEDEE